MLVNDPSLIKALDLDVELIKIDMYQKFEHRRPWFIKVGEIFANYMQIDMRSHDQVLKSFRRRESFKWSFAGPK